MEYLTTNQEIYTRVLDNLHNEHRYFNRRNNNSSIYRNIVNTVTHTETQLINRYIRQRPSNNIWSSFLTDMNRYTFNTPNATIDIPTLDVSNNVTFTEWPNYESVPIDASGVSNPVDRCPISHQEFRLGDSIGRINSCGHVFSEIGLRQWLQRNNTCPMCRTHVDPSFNFLEVRGMNINIPNNTN
tara:strand:- start:1738 stop:2292 length:555 start_codon:yes stop_codon:yes gene_type:complete